jgi:hypothetical protein
LTGERSVIANVPVITNDGKLVDVGELRLADLTMPDGKTKITVGCSNVTVEFSGADVGDDVRALYAAHPKASEWGQVYLRSNVARIGTEAQVLEITPISDGGLRLELNFYYLVKCRNKDTGGDEYPLHVAYRDLQLSGRLRTQDVRPVQLYYIPPTAQPLSREVTESYIASGKLELPSGWTYDAERNAVTLPLRNGQYQIGVAKYCYANGGAEWAAYFRDGKRMLAEHQGYDDVGDSFFRSPLDIRGGYISGDDTLRLILLSETTHPRVRHVRSQHLKINHPKEEDRHFEFVSGGAPVPCAEVRPLGRIYDVSITPPVSVNIDAAPPSSRESLSSHSPSNVSRLDHVLLQSPSVANLARKVAELSGRGVRGLVVNELGAFVMPADREVSLLDWVKTRARSKALVDFDGLERVPHDAVDALVNHPAVPILTDLFRRSSSHTIKNLLVTPSAIPADDAFRLVTTAGIGIFLTSQLHEQALGGASLLGGGHALDIETLGMYQRLSAKSGASFYWVDPGHNIRKFVGPMLIQLQALGFYSNIDFVVALHGGHRAMEAHLDVITPALEMLVAELQGLNMRVGLATASATLSQKLAVAANGSDYIKVIGLHHFTARAMPDFKTPILFVTPYGGGEHMQRILSRFGDLQIVLEGEIGTLLAIIQDLYNESRGVVLPAPTIIGDFTRQGHWDGIVREMRDLEHKSTGPFERAWVTELLASALDPRDLVRDQIRPFLTNPVAFLREKGVPEVIIAAGLRSHRKNADELGRPSSRFLKGAFAALPGES